MSVRLDIGTHLRIDAVLSDGERRALLGAVEELRQCFAATSGDAFPIEVHFHSALSAIKVDSGLVLIVTSLLLELTEPEEPLAAEWPAYEATAPADEAPAHRQAPQPEAPPTRKRGFFARLFGRREPAHAPDEAGTRPSAEEYPAGGPAQIFPAQTAEPVPVRPPLPAPEAWPLQLQAPRMAVEPAPQTVTDAPTGCEPEPIASVAEPDTTAAEPESAAAEPDSAMAEPDSAVAEPESEGEPDRLSEELRIAEEVAAEEVTAVLVAVLDRLGAAHHRPFSRS